MFFLNISSSLLHILVVVQTLGAGNCSETGMPDDSWVENFDAGIDCFEVFH